MQKALFVGALVIGLGFALAGFVLFLVIGLSVPGMGLSLLTDFPSASLFGQFIGGYLGPIFGIVTSFLLFATLTNQSAVNRKISFESSFYKMLDYHQQHVASLQVKHVRSTDNQYEAMSGKRAFVAFRLQLQRLLAIVRESSAELGLALSEDQIVDGACVAFYFGLHDEVAEFLRETLHDFPQPRKLVDYLMGAKLHRAGSTGEYIGRANQTYLSSYFRNLYHLIKYVDTQRILSKKEKIQYMNIVRAQLSDSELWLLYFNVVSRFGRKWLEHRYVEKYRLLRNLPRGFCAPFDPEERFPTVFAAG